MGFEGIRQFVNKKFAEAKVRRENAPYERAIKESQQEQALARQIRLEQKKAEIRKYQQMNRPKPGTSSGNPFGGLNLGSHTGYGQSPAVTTKGNKIVSAPSYGFGGEHYGYGEPRKPVVAKPTKPKVKHHRHKRHSGYRGQPRIIYLR